jgi:hypothetical protein
VCRSTTLARAPYRGRYGCGPLFVGRREACALRYPPNSVKCGSPYQSRRILRRTMSGVRLADRLPEDLGGERLDARAAAPGFGRQARLLAGGR